MAKKSKKSKKGTGSASPASVSTSSQTSDKRALARSSTTEAMLDEYERGSYAGVRHLQGVQRDETNEAEARLRDTLIERTHVDPVQFGVGVGAVLVALAVGLLTLTY